MLFGKAGGLSAATEVDVNAISTSLYTAVSVNGPYKVKRINIFDLLTGVMV